MRYLGWPEFLSAIGDVTRSSYQRAFDCIADASGIALIKIDQP